MTDDTTWLRSFVQIAKDGSFSVAAKNLCITQPALSNRIKSMEERCGFKLFDRSTRKVEPSPQGGVLLPIAQRIVGDLNSIASIISELRGNSENRLRIGGSPHNSAFRWRILDRVMGRYPEISIQVDTTHDARDVLRRLANGDLDIAFSWLEVDSDDFERVHAYSADVGIVAPKGSRIGGFPSITSERLAGETVGVLRREANPNLYDVVVPYLTAGGAKVVIAPEYSLEGLLAHALHTGIPTLVGLTFDPSEGKPSDKPDELEYVPFDDIDLKLDVYAVRRRGIYSHAVKCFWGELSDHAQA